MGTPEFAVASLDILAKNGYDIAAVITAPDKPSGRGLQVQESDMKKYAKEKGLNILQPKNLKDETFRAGLKALNADLFIVLAFRMLPEAVWKMPPLGTFNLHASLLPQYRGAAPINRAIMNGEKETGVTTFFLQQEIDTGKIIFQEKVSIDENETAGELHDKLMLTGAQLVLKTVKAIEAGTAHAIPQSDLHKEPLKAAPKIFREDCRIDWNKPAAEIHNHIRGLSPYPAAWTIIRSGDKKTEIKIYRSEKEIASHAHAPGKMLSDGKSDVKVAVKDGYIHLKEIQAAGKKKMSIEEFLRGFSLTDSTAG